MNNIQIFKSEEFGQVRWIKINDKEYAIGKDVARCLGYSNPRDAISRHCKGVVKHDSFKEGGQCIALIPEGDIFRLVTRSELPGAEKFESWIFDEILPTIRKTGGYVNNDDAFIRTYLPFADETTKAMFKSTLQTVRKQNELIVKQQEEINHKEDVIIGLVDQVTLAEKRQILNRVVRYKGANFQERWRELYRQFSMKYHIDLTKRFESYNLTHKPKMKSKVDYIDKVMTKIPELYEIACKLYENDVKELATQIYQLN